MSMAVSIGKIEETTKSIKESTERRLSNTEAFQMSVQVEVQRLDNEMTAIKTTMKNNFIWIGSIVSIVSLGSPFLVKLIFG